MLPQQGRSQGYVRTLAEWDLRIEYGFPTIVWSRILCVASHSKRGHGIVKFGTV